MMSPVASSFVKGSLECCRLPDFNAGSDHIFACVGNDCRIFLNCNMKHPDLPQAIFPTTPMCASGRIEFVLRQTFTDLWKTSCVPTRLPLTMLRDFASLRSAVYFTFSNQFKQTHVLITFSVNLGFQWR